MNHHVKNIHGASGEKDICGEALSIDAFEKISLVEKDNKEAVLDSYEPPMLIKYEKVTPKIRPALVFTPTRLAKKKRCSPYTMHSLKAKKRI